MAHSTTVTYTCDVCKKGISGSFYRGEIVEIDPEDGGPVATFDLCSGCAKRMVAPVKDRKLIKSLSLR